MFDIKADMSMQLADRLTSLIKSGTAPVERMQGKVATLISNNNRIIVEQISVRVWKKRLKISFH